MAFQSISVRRVDPEGAEAVQFRETLHKHCDPLVEGPERVRGPLPAKSVTLIADGNSIEGGEKSSIALGAVTVKPVTDNDNDSSRRNLEKGKRYAEVKRMIVLPEYRGIGAAAHLLRAIEDVARNDLGTQCLLVETLHVLEPAKRFYEKNGYRERIVFASYDAEQSKCYEKWL